MRKSIVWLLPVALFGAVSVSCSSSNGSRADRDATAPSNTTARTAAAPTPARSPDDAVAAASPPNNKPAPPAADARSTSPQPEMMPRQPARPAGQMTTTAPATQAVPQKPQEEVSNPKSLVRPEKP